MKSFARSQNPRPMLPPAPSRAAKRERLRHQIAWRSIEDADEKWRADLRHRVPGTLSLPPSMRH